MFTGITYRTITMKRLCGWIFTVITISSLLGCQSTYWYQEGKTFDECERDLEACRGELLKRSDLNYIGTYEIKFMEKCMQELGYRVTREKDLPFDVKRRRPEAGGLYALERGVAGTLPEPVKPKR